MTSLPPNIRFLRRGGSQKVEQSKMAGKRGTRPTSEVKSELLTRLLETDTEKLKEHLERLSNESCFGGLTHVWGPALYQKAPKVFRPFILKHFSNFLIEKGWKYRPVPWKGEVAERLQEWMDRVDADDDIDLFKRLYAWRLNGLSHKKASQEWLKELESRFLAASDRTSQQMVLARFDMWFWLTEEAARKLYAHESSLAGPFILSHLPRSYGIFTGEKRKLWSGLAEDARGRGDDDFYFRLYREQIPIKTWKDDVVGLCRRIQNTDELLKELEERHPNCWSADLGDAYAELLEIRGPELFPYLLPKLRRVLRGWFRGSFSRLITLAEKKGWLVLWAGLMRTCASAKEYNKTILEVLKLEPGEAKRRLLLLAGIGHEWNFGGVSLFSQHILDDKSALALYHKYPELLRGPLKAHLNPNWREIYPTLLPTLIRSEDEDLVDFLASRLVTRGGQWGQGKLMKPAEELASYYEKLQKDPAEFARRNAQVLGQVPPGVFWNYNEIIRTNRLARLLYERSAESFLAAPNALMDLIEAPEIHAQILAYRALALDDERAREMARTNLTILLGTLLRPIHRKTRVIAFRALLNAASKPESADRVLQAARQACYLHDLRYPKDDLVHLIAEVLHRWPELRLPEEQPVVYGAVPC